MSEIVEPLKQNETHQSDFVTLKAEPEPLEMDLARTCVIVVDMQNAFLTKGAYIDILGFDIRAGQAAIEPIKSVKTAARARGCKVIYIKTIRYPGDAGPGPDSVYWHKERSLALYRKHPELKDKLLLADTWGTEIVPQLQPQDGDIIVEKPRYSAFFDTNLDTVLKRHNIKYLLTTGVATNNCVEATIRDAYHRGYFAILISNAAATPGPSFTQEASIFNIRTAYGWVTTSDDVLGVLA